MPTTPAILALDQGTTSSRTILFGPDAGLSALDAATRIVVKHLGWDEERVRRDVEAYHALRDRQARAGRV